jgi:hypothetical protein
MDGVGFRYEARGFRYMHGYALRGGFDTATLEDTAGNDLVVSEYEQGSNRKYVRITNPSQGYLARAKFFREVTVNGGTGGVQDEARLYDSSGNDVFEGRYDTAQIYSDDFRVTVNRFGYVQAIAVNGGEDAAYLHDSAEDNAFYAMLSPDPAAPGKLRTEGRLYGTGFANRALGFDYVHGYSHEGGTDTAYLFDSAGDDLLEARPNQIRLSGDAFFYRAKSFDKVFAHSSEGDNDLAVLTDTVFADGNEWPEDIETVAWMQYFEKLGLLGDTSSSGIDPNDPDSEITFGLTS